MTLVINPRFDSFKSTFKDNSIANEYYQLYTPVNALRPGGPILFSVPPGKNFIDFKRTKVRFQIAVRNPEGGLINELDNVSTVPNMLSSLIRSVQIVINNVSFSENSSLYFPYSAFLNGLFTKPPFYFMSSSDDSGWYFDRGGAWADHVPVQEAGHAGQYNRHLRISHGITDFSGHLAIDLASVENFLPGDLDIQIKLEPSSSDFYLLQREDQNVTVEITVAELYIQYVQPSDLMYNSYERALAEKAAIFPYIKTSIRSYSMPTGARSFSCDNILHPTTPSSVTAFMIANDRLTGHKSKSAFRFQHHNLTFCSLMLEGTLINGYGYTCNFDEANPLYSDLLTAYYGEKGSDTPPGIVNLPMLTDGYFLLRWHITDSIRRQPFYSENKAGVSRLTLRFAEDIPEPMNLIVYSTTNTFFTINKDRQIRLSPEAM